MSDSLQPHGLLTHQAPLPMEYSGQEYWSGLPFSTPEELSDPGVKPASLPSPALVDRSLSLHHLGSPLYHYLYPLNNLDIHL